MNMKWFLFGISGVISCAARKRALLGALAGCFFLHQVMVVVFGGSHGYGYDYEYNDNYNNNYNNNDDNNAQSSNQNASSGAGNNDDNYYGYNNNYSDDDGGSNQGAAPSPSPPSANAGNAPIPSYNQVPQTQGFDGTEALDSNAYNQSYQSLDDPAFNQANPSSTVIGDDASLFLQNTEPGEPGDVVGQGNATGNAVTGVEDADPLMSSPDAQADKDPAYVDPYTISGYPLSTPSDVSLMLYRCQMSSLAVRLCPLR